MTPGRRTTVGRGKEGSRLAVMRRAVPLGKAAARRAAEQMVTGWLSSGPWSGMSAQDPGGSPFGAPGAVPGFGAYPAGGIGGPVPAGTALGGLGGPMVVGMPPASTGLPGFGGLGGGHQPLDPSADRGNTDVATTQPAVKYTYEDYRTTPDDQRYELLDGDLIMVPAPNLKHQIVLGRLYYRLQHFVAKHDLGLLLFAPCDVFLSNTNVVQPDLLFVSHERAHLLSGGENVQGPPDLVVEILSPSSAKTDGGAKLNLYSEHGVAEYWLVDPIAETITIHRQRRDELTPTRTFARSDTLRSPLLAGFALDLDEIFAV